MIFLYIGIILFSVTQSATTKFFTKTNDNASVFNVLKSLAAFLLFGILSLLSGFNSHIPTMVYGALYGLLLSLSMYSGYKALASGPMSLTSLIVSFSIVIPLFYGIIFRGEALSPINIIGLVFLVIAIVFTNINKPQTVQSAKGSGKWAFFVLMTFLTNGFCSILQTAHQTAYKSQYRTEFMLFAMLTTTIIFLAVSLINKISSKQTNSSKKTTVKEKLYATASGVANAFAGYFTICLAGFENASILFPTISAGTILCTLLFGVTVLKEKLKYNHYIAVVGGIAAVVLLKL